MYRVLRYVAATAILAALLALPFLISTASISNQVSVIVELRDEPAAVYKARTEKSGGTVSQEQLKAYRDGLAAKQAAFLKALSANGISASVVPRNVNKYGGSLAAGVPLQYSVFYTGMAWAVDQSSPPPIRN